MSPRLVSFFHVLLWLLALAPLPALEPRINEFMADNKNGLADEDGAESDWIEIYNPEPVAKDLTDWYLTDDLAVPMKWKFPVASINGNGYLIVYASGKNRQVPGSQLHTNFSLRAEGESLALVKPNGTTIVSQFTFGPQTTDVSYGLASVTSSEETLISANSAARALVPADNSLGTNWTNTGFSDAAWAGGTLPVGYENGSGYESIINLNVRTAMNGIRNSCYIRVPFTVASLTDALDLKLSMRYDDGFAVYLNGNLLSTAGRNAPGSLTYDAAASADHDDAEAVEYEDIDLAQHLGLLTTGNNVLAIHGLNTGLGSSDFLIGPQLLLTRGTFNNGFMTTPTPGAANGSGVQGFVADTSFSADRGFYNTAFNLTITCATPGAEIRYTKNGDTPTATTGFVYSAPIAITGTTLVRAAAFKAGFQSSNVDTHTYLFLDDVITQSATGTPPPGWPAGPVNNQVFNYGMDPDVVNPRVATIKSALQAIPTVSVVTDLSNLVDAATGIYVNTFARGDSWERPISMEIINDPLNPLPNGFQENCGARLRGGFSRDGNNPKHSFRFFFSKAYGAGKMNYKLFGDAGAPQFDGFDLRTSQDASWAYLGSAENTFLRDEVARATQVQVSYGSRCRYFHLYLNGQYWGLYNTDERPNSKYGAQYFGGDDDEYDVLKSSGAIGGYATEASDGSMAVGSAWETLWTGARLVRTTPTNANYFKLMGRAADGVTPTTDPVLLDPINLADYLMVLFYMGGNDGPVSEYVGASNNWFGMRRRGGNNGFRFFIHDFEQSLGLEASTTQRVGKGATLLPWSNTVSGANQLSRSNPEFMHEDLAPNLEYRVTFGDRAHKHLFNNGPMTDANVLARMNQFAAVIDTAIWGESARWGDAQRSIPFLRDDWLSANERLFNFIRFGSYGATSGSGRAATVIAQLRGYDNGSKPLYPLTNAPFFSQHGGGIPVLGTSVTMNQSNTGVTVLYYTINGADPRMVGGAVHPTALAYTAPVSINAWTGTVRARVKKGTDWSALNEAVFARSSAPPPIRVVEIQASPVGPNTSEITAGFVDKDDFEFLELMNIGTENVNLRDMHFTFGIDLMFPDVFLAPGERGVIVRNQAAFKFRHGPSLRILGEYVGSLNDGGEQVALVSALNTTVVDFTYNNESPWPTGAPGESLVLRSPALDPANPISWRRSVVIGGSPSSTDTTSFSAWKTANGVSNNALDADNDGILPLAEYASGGTPSSNDAARQPTVALSSDLTGPVLLFQFRWKRGADDITAQLQQSANLATWTPVNGTQVSSVAQPDGTDLITVKLPVTAGRDYVRILWTSVP